MVGMPEHPHREIAVDEHDKYVQRAFTPRINQIYRHRTTKKTKKVRLTTNAGVHWIGSYGEYRFESWERWRTWCKKAEEVDDAQTT